MTSTYVEYFEKVLIYFILFIGAIGKSEWNKMGFGIFEFENRVKKP